MNAQLLLPASEATNVAASAAASGDLELCRRSLATHSKSFHLASRLLGANVQDDAAAVYAYCRRVDDAIDGAPPEMAASALDRLERELADVYAGAPQRDPVLRAFQSVAMRRQIHAHYPRELLAGMRMDVEGTHYRNLDDLLLYCHRVAGTVGLMMCHVLGVRRQSALARAAHLGIGMQLTNICRDVAEDWALGRLYLPAALLAAHGTPGLRARLGAEFPVESQLSFRGAQRALLHHADGFYRSGHSGLSDLPFRAAVAIRTAAYVYAEIGAELRRRKWDVLAGRAVVKKSRKLALALRACIHESLSLPRRAAEPFVQVRLINVVRFPDDILCS
ncbi:MAG TPA: phytoene/squalene synthase family protein [Polyangiaceae bacterium]|nr:phytoene/squalene synthase family protein [Polyangiaceae bacterium]